jgi:DmsE family decaheme c-type cytochrome
MSARNWLFSLLCGGIFVVAGAIAGQAADETAAPDTATVAAAADPATPAADPATAVADPAADPATAAADPAADPAAAAADPAADDDSAPPAAEPEYAARGADSCMRCHDKGTPLNILRTAHSMKGDSRTPFAQHACESCHGASPDHMSKPPGPGGRRTSPTVVFKGDRKSPPEVINKVCLTCHENGLRMNWTGSQHQSNDIACTDCHTLHTTSDPMLTKDAQPQTCFKCHSEQRADTLKYSHHPIREGKVVCSDCHNPHGSPGPKLLKEVRVTDTCYNCHAEKRGPFLWEHEPVREDCTLCHNPHGSVNARLLKEKMPYLCIECHGGGTMGDQGYVHSNVISGTYNQYVSDRSCLNCHSQIHGSNSPAGSTFFR